MFLLDYKGKFEIIADEADWMDDVVGEITKEEILKWSKGRVAHHKEMAEYYGVPAIFTKDADLKKLFE